MRDYKKLQVWDKSHQLTLELYKVLKDFPKEEMFALTSQIKRSSSSIPILRKVQEEIQIKILQDFYRLLMVLQMN